MSILPSLYSPTTPLLLKKAIGLTIDGIDGVGKSTLLNRFESYLGDKHYVIRYKEPTERHQAFSEMFREHQKSVMSEYEERRYLDAIETRLVQMNDDLRDLDRPDTVVLLDRFMYCTYAYQGSTVNRCRAIADIVDRRKLGRIPYTVIINPSPSQVGLVYNLVNKRLKERGERPIGIERFKWMVRAYAAAGRDDRGCVRVSPLSDTGRIRTTQTMIHEVYDLVKEMS